MPCFAATTAVVAGLVWSIFSDTRSEPYVVASGALSGWTIVRGEAGDPWLVAAKPPETMTTALLQQVSRKTGTRLIAPPHTAMPLVLRDEYADGLQGAIGLDEIVRMAEESGLQSARFQPVCIGHRVTEEPQPREFFFVAFNSREYWQLRIDLTPQFPEQAGAGTYEPNLQSPVLPIGATDADFTAWWPMTVDQLVDCQAQLTVR